MAIRAGVGVMLRRRSMASRTVRSGIVSIDDVIPALGGVTARTPARIVRLGGGMAVGAHGVASMVKMNAFDPRHNRVAVRAQPVIVRIGGVIAMTSEAIVGIDVVEV